MPSLFAMSPIKKPKSVSIIPMNKISWISPVIGSAYFAPLNIKRPRMIKNWIKTSPVKNTVFAVMYEIGEADAFTLVMNPTFLSYMIEVDASIRVMKIARIGKM